MARDARQEAAVSPPPVAVHDHRNVTRQTFEINLFEQHFVPRAGLNYFKEIFQHCRCSCGAFDSDLMFMTARNGQKQATNTNTLLSSASTLAPERALRPESDLCFRLIRRCSPPSTARGSIRRARRPSCEPDSGETRRQ